MEYQKLINLLDNTPTIGMKYVTMRLEHIKSIFKLNVRIQC